MQEEIKIAGNVTGNVVVRGSAKSINVSGGSVKGGIGNLGTITEAIKVSQGASIQGDIENRGQVKDAITIAGEVKGNFQNTGTVAKKIEITSGASVASVSNSGMVQEEIKVAGEVKGEITITEKASVGKLEIASTGSVDKGVTNSGIIKEEIKLEGKLAGNITNSGNISGGITIAQSANLSGKIENKKDATITGGITNNSDNKLVVNSEGKIEKNTNGDTITNNGNGGVEVEAFLVVGNSNGVPEKLIIGGNGDQSKNKTGKLTIDTSVDTKELAKGGFALVEGVNKENVGTFAHIDPEIQIEIERTIFSQNSNKVGRTVTKALSVSADKRANFADYNE